MNRATPDPNKTPEQAAFTSVAENGHEVHVLEFQP